MADTPVQNRNYDRGIRQADKLVSDLHAHLRRKLERRPMIFCVTSDHGEQIGDHGLAVGHADIYRETVNVPLIIAGDGIKSRRVADYVSTMDVGATLLALAGGRYRASVDGRDVSSMMTTNALLRMLTPPTKRRFLVMGMPTYTRSIALLDGNEWFIKNFENVYRYISIGESADSPAELRRHGSLKPSVEGGVASYFAPFTQFKPFVATFTHVGGKPECSLTATVKLAPGIVYQERPIKFQESISITVSAARLDQLFMEVTPASCAGETFVTFRRPDGSEFESHPAALETDLYRGLVARRVTTADELYDVQSDPGMRRNLWTAESSSDRERELRLMFEDVVTKSPFRKLNTSISDEERKRLKSLGYLH